MTRNRLEAFSDGVIAIIITIMVLELRAPHDATLVALKPLWPVLSGYVLSFIYVGIYWSNHHHLFQAVRRVSGSILWANLHLLFWLSLIPFVTAWMGDNLFARIPVACYGGVLLMCAVAYWLLVRVLLAHHEEDSVLARAVGRDFKGNISLVFYIVGIALAWVSSIAACACYVAVAIMWLVPDTRIERVLESSVDSEGERGERSV